MAEDNGMVRVADHESVNSVEDDKHGEEEEAYGEPVLVVMIVSGINNLTYINCSRNSNSENHPNSDSNCNSNRPRNQHHWHYDAITDEAFLLYRPQSKQPHSPWIARTRRSKHQCRSNEDEGEE